MRSYNANRGCFVCFDLCTVQFLCNAPRYNMYLDIIQSCCGSEILTRNFTKEL